MPMIHVTQPAGLLSDAARDALAEDLTAIGLDCEGLPATPFVRSTAWVYFVELPPTHVYHGGAPGGRAVVSLECNVFEGGLSDAAKRSLYERYTAAIRRHARLPEDDAAPVYVIVREVRPEDWGVFGGTITLDELRHPPADARPL